MNLGVPGGRFPYASQRRRRGREILAREGTASIRNKRLRKSIPPTRRSCRRRARPCPTCNGSAPTTSRATVTRWQSKQTRRFAGVGSSLQYSRRGLDLASAELAVAAGLLAGTELLGVSIVLVDWRYGPSPSQHCVTCLPRLVRSADWNVGAKRMVARHSALCFSTFSRFCSIIFAARSIDPWHFSNCKRCVEIENHRR